MTDPTRRPAIAFGIDVALVVLFAAIGRASHAESNAVTGAVVTASPFLAGTVIGWSVVRLLHKRWPVAVGPGITVWFSTLVVGMLLRAATGQGTALAFVGVAALTLAAFLVGWRSVATVASRPRPRL